MTTLQDYRDDGVLAQALGGILPGDRSRRPPVALLLTVAGALPLALVLARAADPGLAVALGVAWWVLCAGAASGQELRGRLDWLVPPLLRGVEYAAVVRLVVLADGPLWACYAYLAAVAYHHYDTVYRLRHRHVTPPDWLRRVGGGWDVRLRVVGALALTGGGGLGVGLAVAALFLGLLYVIESTAGWLSPKETLEDAA